MEAKVQAYQADVAEVPTKAQHEAFLGVLKGMTDKQIADARYPEHNFGWGRYDPTNPVNSSWKVRAANREIAHRDAAREESRAAKERSLVIWGIAAAFFTGWVAIAVAAMAIPLEKSVYCALFGC